MVENHCVFDLLQKLKFAPKFVSLLFSAVFHRPQVNSFGGAKGGRLIKRIQGNPETVVQQFGNYAGQQGTLDLKTGICVGFNHLHSEVLFNHEVVPKDLKRVLFAARV